MQSTGHGSRHLSQPEHSSGMMITSIPWLKIAPNCGGQWRMHASQLMQIDMSIRNGGFFHFGLRSRASRRSGRVAAAMHTKDYVDHGRSTQDAELERDAPTIATAPDLSRFSTSDDEVGRDWLQNCILGAGVVQVRDGGLRGGDGAYAAGTAVRDEREAHW